MSDDPAEAAERLEAALERIAGRLGARPVRSGGPVTDQVDRVELRRRLDAMIVRLRGALDGADPSNE